MGHEVDNIGLPIDPELKRLQFQLTDLAVMWRGNRNNPENASEIVEKYKMLLLHMYELGWDGDLHPEAQLPDRFMPEEWFQHNPEYRA